MPNPSCRCDQASYRRLSSPDPSDNSRMVGNPSPIRSICGVPVTRAEPRFGFLTHSTSRVALAGRGARIEMVLLLDDLAVFNTKCVEHIKRLAVREANLGLAGNPPTIACVVMQDFKAADCGQDAGEKVEDSFASADQRAFTPWFRASSFIASSPPRSCGNLRSQGATILSKPIGPNKCS